jgi:enoyl-CoA hydratase
VAPGEARAHAEILARQLSAFPQQCLLTDRAAVYGGWELPLEQALALESAHGMPVMLEEGVHGAQRFLAGAGRHGSFDC